MMRCSVQNCCNDTKKTKSHGITFHLFPKEAKLRSSWIEALNLTDWEPKEGSTICSEHFRNEDFYQTKTGLRKIKNDAVPVVAQDSTEDLEAPAALRVCRICLTMDTRMFDIRHHKLEQLYEELTGVFYFVEDRLPQRICWECAHRLNTAAAFREKALTSHTLLSDTLRSTTYLKIRDVKSIDRSRYNLKSILMFKIYEPNDCDVLIKDEIITCEARQEENEHDYNENENGEMKEIDNIKGENHSNGIFDEYVDIESDDDKKFVIVGTENKKDKMKKKKMCVEKKVRAVKRPQEEDECSNSILDKYKTNENKRRKKCSPDENLFTITTLTYEEQIAEIKKRQESKSYKKAIYKCTICYRGFQHKDRYNVHLFRHTNQCGAYECAICKTHLKNRRALRNHLTSLHTEKFSCKECPFVSRNRSVARMHEKYHSGTKYQCPHCPCEFEKRSTYMSHIRVKHVSNFVCELCGYTFVNAKGIEVHKKKKHRLHDRNEELTGPYCEMCDVKFLSEEAHARHLKLSASHSSDNDPNRLRNDSQSMSHPNQTVRKIERRPVIHPRSPRADCQPGPVTCEQCGVQLRNMRFYAQHFRRAHPDKNRTKLPAMKTPYMCEQCGRIFQSLGLLKDHMWVHTGEKRFKCTVCLKTFTQKCSLVFHSRLHSTSRPTFECPLCGKHFAFNSNKRKHMLIHTGLKPFKCETCSKCFTTAGELRAHVDHVHLKKPWPRRPRRQGALGGGDGGG